MRGSDSESAFWQVALYTDRLPPCNQRLFKQTDQLNLYHKRTTNERLLVTEEFASIRLHIQMQISLYKDWAIS